jgi:hypothetical protein
VLLVRKMTTIQYTISSEIDLALFQLSFISMMEELMQCKDISVYCYCSESMLDACTKLIEEKFNKNTAFALSCGTECKQDSISMDCASLVLFGALRAYVDATDRITICSMLTEQDNDAFRVCLEEMQTHCKIPNTIFVFGGEKKQVAGVMHQCLQLILSMYNHIDSIMESIQQKMQGEKESPVSSE